MTTTEISIAVIMLLLTSRELSQTQTKDREAQTPKAWIRRKVFQMERRLTSLKCLISLTTTRHPSRASTFQKKKSKSWAHTREGKSVNPVTSLKSWLTILRTTTLLKTLRFATSLSWSWLNAKKICASTKTYSMQWRPCFLRTTGWRMFPLSFSFGERQPLKKCAKLTMKLVLSHKRRRFHLLRVLKLMLNLQTKRSLTNMLKWLSKSRRLSR